MGRSWCDKCDGPGVVRHRGRYVTCRCCRSEGANWKPPERRNRRWVERIRKSLLPCAAVLSLCGSARAASVHEPKLTTTAHSVEHTVSGTRVFLRRGYPNEKTSFARTIRLTVYRSQMGECVEAKVERDNCFTIGGDAKVSVYHGKEMTQAIDSFCREAYIPDRCVEITRDETTKRMKLSEVLNERRILDPFFLEDHREFSWCHEAHELVVEGKR